MDIKELFGQFTSAIADLNQVNDLLKANVHTAADRQREHEAALRALINKLKSQSGVLTEDDVNQLQAIHDGLQNEISNLKESANAVTIIVPPDVPADLTDGSSGGAPSAPPNSADASGGAPAEPASPGDAPEPAPAPPPSGDPTS